MHIWVDADACPAPIKEIRYRVAERREIGLTQRLGAFPSPGARALMEEIGKVVAGSADFR